MSRGLLVALVVIAVLVLGIGGWAVSVNNQLVRLDQGVGESWAQAQLSGALSRLLVTVERYPELKSNQNFLALQSQLEGTENRITVERRRFNEAVREYNTRLRLFPGSIVARFAGYQPKAFFEAAPDAATPPKVKF